MAKNDGEQCLFNLKLADRRNNETKYDLSKTICLFCKKAEFIYLKIATTEQGKNENRNKTETQLKNHKAQLPHIRYVCFLSKKKEKNQPPGKDTRNNNPKLTTEKTRCLAPPQTTPNLQY